MLLAWYTFKKKKIIQWILARNQDKIPNNFWNGPKHRPAILYCVFMWSNILGIYGYEIKISINSKNTEDVLCPGVSNIQPRFSSLCKINEHIHLNTINVWFTHLYPQDCANTYWAKKIRMGSLRCSTYKTNWSYISWLRRYVQTVNERNISIINLSVHYSVEMILILPIIMLPTGQWHRDILNARA